MHHYLQYLVPLLDKKKFYIVLYVGTNDVIDNETSEILQKLLKQTVFLNLELLDRKVVISRLIKRFYKVKVKSVIDDVVMQLKNLNTDMLINENIERSHLGKNVNT